jgi:hypothetical protein
MPEIVETPAGIDTGNRSRPAPPVKRRLAGLADLGPTPRSGNVHAGGGAGDDEALDLGGALEERVGPWSVSVGSGRVAGVCSRVHRFLTIPPRPASSRDEK